MDNNGDIPKGHKIIFLDGDNSNFDVANLVCVSSAENLRMNRKRRYNKNRTITETYIALTKLEVAMFEKRKENKWKY